MTPNNTIVYPEAWKTKLQARLDQPQNWKEVCNVEYTNSRVIHNPYIADPAVQTHVRGSQYTWTVLTETDDSTTISTSKLVSSFVDRADLAQSTFTMIMDLADRQGTKLNEAIETAMLASHASWTDFTNASIGGAAGSITVSATNIDDVIRGIKREIREANGEALMNQNGAFIVWRAADFEILESYMQANGFNLADYYLRNGNTPGVYYAGMYHYVSNSHTAATNTHLFGGVRKLFHLGILTSTYGQTMVNDKDPYNFSGVSITTRVDYAFKAWNNTSSVLFDIAVN